MKPNYRLWLLAALLSTGLIAGCGGGGGGRSAPGSVSGYIIFDENPTSLHVTSKPILQKKGSRKPKLYTASGYTQKSVPNEKLIRFRSGLSSTAIEKLVRDMGGKIKQKVYGFNDLYLISIESKIFTSSAIKNNPDIIYTEENYIFHASAIRLPTEYPTIEDVPWNYSMLRMPEAWDISIGIDNIIVAVIDTGVGPHPDLDANLTSGRNFVANPDNSNTDDDEGHGTHVAGIIGAVANNGGVTGVVWDIQIMPIKALDSYGEGNLTDIVEGINWAAAHGAHVINLSLGGAFTAAEAPQSMKDAIDNAIARGITVVAAAGNYDLGIPGYDYTGVNFPANYSPVIAVAALAEDGTRAEYSCYGPEVFISAPGGPIYSTYPINTYDTLYGTSMACPHISGLVALLYSRGIANPEAIRDRLQVNSEDLGMSGRDIYYGWGLPRADAVLFESVPDLRSIKVFVGDIEGNMLSTPRNPDGTGYYSLTLISPGARYICAFLDRDMNGLVNTGDKFISQLVTITANTNTILNLTVQQVEEIAGSMTISEYYKKFILAKSIK